MNASTEITLSTEIIREKLAASAPQALEWAGFRKAAVVVPLIPKETGWEILFTVRSSKLSSHAGEVAFPGGRLDEGESVLTAACRELEEELGIQAAEILGTLDDHPSPAKYTTTPVVARLEPSAPIVPSPDEVASVFTVPLSTLLSIDPRSKDVYVLGKGRGRRLHFFDVAEQVIWGMTGNVLINFLNVLQDKAEERPWLIPDKSD